MNGPRRSPHPDCPVTYAWGSAREASKSAIVMATKRMTRAYPRACTRADCTTKRATCRIHPVKDPTCERTPAPCTHNRDEVQRARIPDYWLQAAVATLGLAKPNPPCRFANPGQAPPTNPYIKLTQRCPGNALLMLADDFRAW